MKNLPVPINGLTTSMFATPECEVVAMLSRQPLTSVQRERAMSAVDAGIDWTRAFKLAEHWEVEPVFFANLARHDHNIPEETIEKAKTNELRARSRATAAALWTADVLRRLEDAGIPCMVIKGPALGILAYDDLSYRTFADADLLVSRNDLIRAMNHLQTLGFEPVFKASDIEMLIRNGHALEFSNSGRKVELHWTLLSLHLGLDLPVHDLWKLAIPVEIAGHHARTLDRGSLFVFLSAHGAKHEWERFRWVCDVAQLGDRLSKEEIARVDALARIHNARKIVLLAIEMARSLAGSELAALRSHFGDGRALAPLVTRAMHHYETLAERPPSSGPDDFNSRLAALKYWIGVRERIRDRALVVSRAFLSPLYGSGRNLPVEILHRSARLMSIALRRSTS